jgi:hypothetical protein
VPEIIRLPQEDAPQALERYRTGHVPSSRRELEAVLAVIRIAGHALLSAIVIIQVSANKPWVKRRRAGGTHACASSGPSHG